MVASLFWAAFNIASMKEPGISVLDRTIHNVRKPCKSSLERELLNIYSFECCTDGDFRKRKRDLLKKAEEKDKQSACSFADYTHFVRCV